MKDWAILTGTVLVGCLALAGCAATKAPPAIEATWQAKDTAVRTYQRNNDLILEALIKAYRAAEVRTIEANYARDIDAMRFRAQATQGMVKLEDAIEAYRHFETARQAAIDRVDAEIASFREIVARAQVDMAVALKLDEVLHQYESAGVDMSAAKNAISQIMDLLQQRKAVPK